MKRFQFVFLFVLISMVMAGNAFSQFHYIGAEEQFVRSPQGTSHLVTSIGYLKQFGVNHGLGVEIGVPMMLSANHAKAYTEVIDTVNYDVGLIWKRNFLPTLGLRYRLFVGNSFFIGPKFDFGLLRERFYADRYYHVSTASTHEGVNPVYLDYVLKSPFFRASFEMGFVWNMGEKMYGTLQGRVGVQVTKARVSNFGTFSTNSSTVATFEPFHGAALIGGASFGLGIKL
jgi:hypothetical protein